MNPLTGALKFLASSIFTSLFALVFFLVAGRVASPVLVGQVAVLQLVEGMAYASMSLMPTPVVTREVAHGLGSGRRGYGTVATSALGFTLMASPFMLFVFLFPSYVPLALPYYLLGLYSNYQSSVLQGRGRFTDINVANMTFTLVKWGLSTAGISFGIGWIVMAWTAAAAIRTGFFQWMLRGVRPRIDVLEVRRIVVTGLPVYLSGLAAFVAAAGDRLIVTYLMGAYFIGIYQLVALAASVPTVVGGSVSSALMPSATYYAAKGHGLKEMSSPTFRMLALFGFTAGVAGAGVAPFFISHLFPKYALGIPAMQLLLLSFSAMIPFTALQNYLITKASYRPFAVIAAAGAAVDVAASLLLIPAFGVTGAALAQAATDVVVSLTTAYFCVVHGVFEIGKKEKLTVMAIPFLLMGVTPAWPVLLALVPLAFRQLSLVTRGDFDQIGGFVPGALKPAYAAVRGCLKG